VSKLVAFILDIRYLNSLIAVVELGSIAHAARSQNLTAAAVGQRILALEKHFNTALLNRKSHKATPTEACLNLLPRARHIVREFYDMNADIDNSGLAGKFHLGAISTALTGILPKAIKQLSFSAPGLILQIKPGTSNSLFTDLGDRRIDAAIIALPPYSLPNNYHFQVLRDEPLMLISNQSAGNNIREKLTQNPYICYDTQSWGGLKAGQFLKDKSIDIEPYYELDALEAIEKLVQQRMGVSLVPQWAGLDLKSTSLDAEMVRPNRYARRVVLITQADSPRKRMVEVLNQALMTQYL
jgi:DNA-binding transcriptional LysR family regulator